MRCHTDGQLNFRHPVAQRFPCIICSRVILLSNFDRPWVAFSWPLAMATVYHIYAKDRSEYPESKDLSVLPFLVIAPVYMLPSWYGASTWFCFEARHNHATALFVSLFLQHSSIPRRYCESGLPDSAFAISLGETVTSAATILPNNRQQINITNEGKVSPVFFAITGIILGVDVSADNKLLPVGFWYFRLQIMYVLTDCIIGLKRRYSVSVQFSEYSALELNIPTI